MARECPTDGALATQALETRKQGLWTRGTSMQAADSTRKRSLTVVLSTSSNRSAAAPGVLSGADSSLCPARCALRTEEVGRVVSPTMCAGASQNLARPKDYRRGAGGGIPAHQPAADALTAHNCLVPDSPIRPHTV
jgi:hypothetical protein